MRWPKLHRFLFLTAAVKCEGNSVLRQGGKRRTRNVEVPAFAGTTVNFTQAVCENWHISLPSGDIRLKVRHSAEAIHSNGNFHS